MWVESIQSVVSHKECGSSVKVSVNCSCSCGEWDGDELNTWWMHAYGDAFLISAVATACACLLGDGTHHTRRWRWACAWIATQGLLLSPNVKFLARLAHESSTVEPCGHIQAYPAFLLSVWKWHQLPIHIYIIHYKARLKFINRFETRCSPELEVTVVTSGDKRWLLLSVTEFEGEMAWRETCPSKLKRPVVLNRTI